MLQEILIFGISKFLFDIGEQHARVVVAITQLAAVRVDMAADQVQVGGAPLVVGDGAAFVLAGDVPAEGVGCRLKSAQVVTLR
ncbi:hypothetical protein C1Y35_17675 [Pseudomonas sp. GW456-L14]|nr:hypothetical protein C1Y35_17675 [Pseudomonas sp. GW456-L14]PMY52780.1 hypothetical protein C1Y34_21400 [Pseudomonas sp. GW456-L12]